MKKIITILAIFISSLAYTQDYNDLYFYDDYKYEYYDNYDYEYHDYPVYKSYRDGTSVYIRGNYNNVLITKERYLETDNTEYNKSNSFDPDKTLQEILSDSNVKE